eukprot:822997-Pyramimonas_sp.AAC.1
MIVAGSDLIMGPLAVAALPKLEELKPDVLCVFALAPSGYALGEALNVPAVGLGFAAPWIFSSSLDAVWSLQPTLG